LAYPPLKTKQNPRDSSDALWLGRNVSFYEGFTESACGGGFCQTMCWIGEISAKIVRGLNGMALP